MENKIEFITEVEENSAENLFEEYYEKNIVPLVEEENRLKRVFRSRFWGYLWSVCFLLGVNMLVVLFRYLMYGYPISVMQIFLVTLVGLAVVSWPLICYYRAQKDDMFGEFLKFYGQWQHHENKETAVEQMPLVPTHEIVSVPHSIIGTYDGTEIEICDMLFQNIVKVKNWSFKRTVSKGVMVRVKFNKKINNQLLMFDKKGFRHKNKYPDLINVTDQILIPMANFFNIFTDDETFAKDMLPTLFFERILDLKEIFKAAAVNVEIQEDYMRIYLENAQLYFNNQNIWSHHINKDKFVTLNKEMEQALMTAQLVQVLRDAL
ncbi:MAG: DUF3137 domain-containing protein [Alphaproteobacteria bacterium]|nr:DUF3137 domain-containing protein [Alphaproteobacteria bacterium]